MLRIRFIVGITDEPNTEAMQLAHAFFGSGSPETGFAKYGISPFGHVVDQDQGVSVALSGIFDHELRVVLDSLEGRHQVLDFLGEVRLKNLHGTQHQT